MERQDSKNAVFLQSSFRFFDHHKTVKSVINFLFSMKHIGIDDKIKEAVFKIMAVILPSGSRRNAADLLILCFTVYVIKALLVDIHSVHFAFLTKSMCRSKRIITGSAAIIKNYRISHIKDRRKDLCTFLFLPTVYFIENTHINLL